MAAEPLHHDSHRQPRSLSGRFRRSSSSRFPLPPLSTSLSVDNISRLAKPPVEPLLVPVPPLPTAISLPPSPRRSRHQEERPPLPAAQQSRQSSVDSAQSSPSSSDIPDPISAVVAPSLLLASAPAPGTPASLISNAASPQEAMEKLSQELQTTVTRNEQLWGLVEKQRTMMLGLNKDLERALRDRDRYRRKLREHLAVVDATHAASRIQRQPLVELSHAVESTRLRENGAIQSNMSGAQSPALVEVDAPPSLLSTADDAAESSLIEESSAEKAPRITSWLSSGEGSGDGSSPMMSPDKDKVDLGRQPRPGESLKTLPMIGVAERLRAEMLRKSAPSPMNLDRSALNVSHKSHDEDSASDYEDDSKTSLDTRSTGRGRRVFREEDQTPPRISGSYADHPIQRSHTTISSSSPRLSAEAKARHERTHAIVGDNTRDIRLSPSTPRSPPIAPSLVSLQQTPAGYDPPGNTTSHSLPRLTHRPSQTFFFSTKSPALLSDPEPADQGLNSPTQRLSLDRTFSEPTQDAKPRLWTPGVQQMLNDILGQSMQESGNRNSSEASDQLSLLPQSPRVPTQAISAAISVSTAAANSNNGLDAIVYKGFMTEQFPGLLLPPTCLPYVDVRINSSRLRPLRSSTIGAKQNEDESAFVLAVHSRSNGSQLWRLEKTLAILTNLDQQLKMASAFNARLPDKNLFSGHSPIRVDMRRAALVQYFTTMLTTLMNERAALTVCEFLSCDVMEPQLHTTTANADSGVALAGMLACKRTKEGYLTKKGKQWGGWKSRYFVIESSELHYYEAPGGQHLGFIRLRHSYVAKQHCARKDEADESDFRHALIVLESKRKDASNTRHVLCAESDEDRDDWVDVLLQYVDASSDDANQAPSKISPSVSRRQGRTKTPEPQLLPNVQAVSYNEIISADTSVVSNIGRSSSTHDSEPSRSSIVSSVASTSHPLISGPVAGVVIHNYDSWPGKMVTIPQAKEKETKKRSIFGFKRGGDDAANPSKLVKPSQRPLLGEIPTGSEPSHGVFGVNLADAAEHFPPTDVDICLPSPVYRCIEYLEAKNAASEEGIFRLSGSNLVIKSLKERFNKEGDVKLVHEQHYDIHVVASVLKLYLRELPASVLTRELHLDFLRVLDLQDKQGQLATLNMLIHKLPEANFELVATLSRFLIDIVSNSEINKMTVRNVGIVFSPTLNVPAALFSLFLTDYDFIFPRSIDSDKLCGPSYNDVLQYGPGASSDRRSSRNRRSADLTTQGHQQHSAFRSSQPNSHNTRRLSTTAVAHQQPNLLPASETSVVSVEQPQAINNAVIIINTQSHQQNYQARPLSQTSSTTPTIQQTQPRDRASSGATFAGYHGPPMSPNTRGTPLQPLPSPAPAIFNNDMRSRPQSPSSSLTTAESTTYRSSAHGSLNFLAQSSPLTPLRKGRPSSGLLADAPLSRRPSGSGSSDMQMQARRKSSMQRLKQIAGI